MKHNTREALFNLVGGWVPGKIVIDLFAGTGAVGLEALSRGAKQAYLIERHIPTVKVIQSNVNSLDPDLPAVVDSSDTFFWARQFVKQQHEFDAPLMIFCCAPYALYLEKQEGVLEMLAALQNIAPDESLIVVEADSRFDMKQLPQPELWKTREYAPAVISVCKIGFPDREGPSHE